MRVLRGGEGDRDATGDLLAHTAETGEPGVRVWRPGRQIAFGRRDTREDGYDRAREAAIERGFPPVERRVGGRAVAYVESTVGFVATRPVEEGRGGIRERYEEVTTALQRALWRLGVPAQRGEPEDAFCPGTYSLSWKGKVAGVAQRVGSDAALVGGMVIVDGRDEIADVLAPVYDALGVALDPDSVGSIERAGGRADPAAVEGTVETLLVGDAETEVVEGEA